ncbi:MAG: hypothetical protein K0S08_1997 [Gammaproteobacteria bacterium]|jgi:hypothetical protein|nr:hypothetical protein [Gammaproteobacteria bacterium]MCE3238248.1 hypothetical protein [Gammaproteobacteria bacterium]
MTPGEMKAEFQKLERELSQHLPETDTQSLFALINEVILLNIDMLESISTQEHDATHDTILRHNYEIEDIESVQQELFDGQDALSPTIKSTLEEIIEKSGQKPELVSICKQIEALSAEGIKRLEELLDELLKEHSRNQQELSRGSRL